MTEGEAKTKWCPFSRVVQTGYGSGLYRRDSATAGNRLGDVDNGTEGLLVGSHCIGSACMAWREIIKDREAPSPAPLGVREKYSAGGYCGLAGKP
jgi:hypothetical protein